MLLNSLNFSKLNRLAIASQNSIGKGYENVLDFNSIIPVIVNVDFSQKFFVSYFITNFVEVLLESN